jgi:hypothetical protein
MDLYSSLRVVRRWWYLAVPLLLLTALGVVAAVSLVSSSRHATGEVVLLAAPTPPAATNENPNPPEANNPYALMALPDIVDVLSRSVSSDATALALEARGLQGTYTVEGNLNFQRGPIITIETTSPTRRAALRSYSLVADELEARLDGLQDQLGANPAFRVKMQRLTTPQVAPSSTLTDLRAALIAAAIGLLLTLAVVFGAESISRGRARRRLQLASEGPSVEAISPNGDQAGAAGVHEDEPHPVLEAEGGDPEASFAGDEAPAANGNGSGSGDRVHAEEPLLVTPSGTDDANRESTEVEPAESGTDVDRKEGS